ncbi:2193_t:CDS:2 [Dentiscutata heterogama]|uniref:2193_t:CDS:1 n=1 Tax=Dentiscutata heterogama TaxID=1316150 RepID=A0ACA9LDC1_9GLOM|nr:2193_t:CDS:2 [Dentiscutata heterogama]
MIVVLAWEIVFWSNVSFVVLSEKIEAISSKMFILSTIKIKASQPIVLIVLVPPRRVSSLLQLVHHAVDYFCQFQNERGVKIGQILFEGILKGLGSFQSSRKSPR